jgi:hypothetical protein
LESTAFLFPKIIFAVTAPLEICPSIILQLDCSKQNISI